MKLHKQEIVVKEYIQDVVDTVAAEAREKSISIVLKKGFGTLFTKAMRNSSLRQLVGSARHGIVDSVRVLSGIYHGGQNSNVQHSHEVESFAAMKENDEFMDLLDEDMVLADKFKMDQVIRSHVK